jgi:hypothetical protein
VASSSSSSWLRFGVPIGRECFSEEDKTTAGVMRCMAEVPYATQTRGSLLYTHLGIVTTSYGTLHGFSST